MRIPTTPEDGTCHATTWPVAPDEGLRSEDSATGKTEGGRIELRRSHALRMTEPHADALAHGKRDATQAIGDLRRLEEEAWRIHCATPTGYQINERGLARQGIDFQLTVRREGLARDVLHHRDGALAHERDGHRMGAHAVARDAAGGVGGVKEAGDELSLPRSRIGGGLRRPEYNDDSPTKVAP